MRTTADHSARNGLWARLNQTINVELQTMLNEKRLEEWDVVLCDVMFAYNTTVHSTTGFTQNFLMFGVEARILCEILGGLPENQSRPAAYAFQRYQKLGVGYEAPRESAYTAEKLAKDYYHM